MTEIMKACLVAYVGELNRKERETCEKTSQGGATILNQPFAEQDAEARKKAQVVTGIISRVS
jgi:hypothetical protein